MGAEWPVNIGADLKHKRELTRFDECASRLNRARTLPLPAPKLALIVSTGCLSLLDFLNLPDPKPYLKLRSLVKDVFGLKAGAPEVVTCLFLRGTLDPHMRWLMAILRIWHHILQMQPMKSDVDEIIEQGRGRLGKGAIHAYRWGTSVSEEGMNAGTTWIPAREQWFIVRKAGAPKRVKNEFRSQKSGDL